MSATTIKRRKPCPLTPCPRCGRLRRTHRKAQLCRDCAGGPCFGTRLVPDDPDAGNVVRVLPPRPLPAEPTGALPGWEEKVRVLEERAARGECLWHPADRQGFEGAVGHPSMPESAYRLSLARGVVEND